MRETVEVLMPSIRPRSFKSLDTVAQQRASIEDFEKYAQALASGLTTWRTRMGGRGRFHVNVSAGDPERAGPSGIVRITYSAEDTDEPSVDTEVSDELVLATLGRLREEGLRIIASGDFLALLPDVQLWSDGALYLVRPLTRRSWTVRQAVRDAEQIVRGVQAQRMNTDMAVTA